MNSDTSTAATPTRPRQLITEAICAVAPDIEPADIEALAADDLIKDELDLDSMDVLNVATAIFERSSVDIPDRDYVHMETMAAFESYLADRLPTAN